MIHASVGIFNAGEQQANALQVELFDGERLVGEMRGSAYILPGKVERYSITGKFDVEDRSTLRVEAQCETCTTGILNQKLFEPAPESAPK